MLGQAAHCVPDEAKAVAPSADQAATASGEVRPRAAAEARWDEASTHAEAEAAHSDGVPTIEAAADVASSAQRVRRGEQPAVAAPVVKTLPEESCRMAAPEFAAESAVKTDRAGCPILATGAPLGWNPRPGQVAGGALDLCAP